MTKPRLLLSAATLAAAIPATQAQSSFTSCEGAACEGDAMVVTGSPITRPHFEAAEPTAIISAADTEHSGRPGLQGAPIATLEGRGWDFTHNARYVGKRMLLGVTYETIRDWQGCPATNTESVRSIITSRQCITTFALA